MRITRENLTKLARDTVAQRIRSDRNIIAAYLCGSLLEESCLLGGAAAVDLVLIHGDQALTSREIQPVTDEVHLDIAHYFHRDFRQTRLLRVNPWLGPTLKDCQILYDPQHFLDFTQASVRGQFGRADHVMERVRQHFDRARQAWSSFHTSTSLVGPAELLVYLKAVRNAAGAVGSLGGKLLTERRFLPLYRQWVETIHKPGLYAGILGLLGGASLDYPHVDGTIIQAWLPAWETAYRAVPPGPALIRLHPQRELYYRRAMNAYLDGAQPQDTLWPLLYTWTLAASQLPADHPALADWKKAFEYLGLLSGGFHDRLQALDAYLDLVEETIDDWARANGAEFET